MNGAEIPTPGGLTEFGGLHRSDNGQRLSVVTIFQDALSRAWIDRFWERIRRALGPIAFRSASWRIGDFAQETLIREAVAAAAGADVIVIAIRADEVLPAALCDWLDSWALRRGAKDGVLVALLGVNSRSASRLEIARRYLRSAAKQGRMDLLIEECPDSGRPPSAAPGVLPESGIC